jgi:hypothetical protein
MNHAQKYLAQANRHFAELAVQIVRQRVIVKHALARASAQRWRSRCLMRLKEAFVYSRSTGYFCAVATDRLALCLRPSRHWVKSKNPTAPAVKPEAEVGLGQGR